MEHAVPLAHIGPKHQYYAKNLYLLCKQYKFGLNVKNPEREFTRNERGQNKCLYCMCKVFWDVVEKLILRVYRIYFIHSN